MKTWIWLAWIEWYRSSVAGKPNSDFGSLTALLFLTLLLALLLWGGREGLLNRFVDVSVGYLDDAGIPIWLAASTPRGIDRTLLEALLKEGITLYPYREVEWHEVTLPGDREQRAKEQHEKEESNRKDTNRVWKGTTVDGTTVSFSGWAVSFQDPLWKAAVPTAGSRKTSLPLEVVLNTALFQQSFNCHNYRAVLQKKLPFITAAGGDERLDCLANGVIWLDVKARRNNELLPFKIHWQPNIFTLEKLAFLFPLSTFNALKLSDQYPGLRYYPEAQENDTTRVKELIIWENKEPLSEEQRARVMGCLPGATRKHARITLNPSLPKPWIFQCLRQVIPLAGNNERVSAPFLTIGEEESSHQFRMSGDFLEFVCPDGSSCDPCKNEDTSVLTRIEGVKCDATRATIDLIPAVGTYTKAFAYIANRTALATQVDWIKKFRLENEDQAFYLHCTYEDALVRFRFIDRILGILEKAFIPFFLGFLMVLLMVQVGIVIRHRRHNYGMLLAKGMAWSHICGVVFTQVTLSFFTAMILAVLVDEGMQCWLAGKLQSVVREKPYVDHIVTGGLDLLPLNLPDYLRVGGGVIGILYLITGWMLWRMLLTGQREPANLF